MPGVRASILQIPRHFTAEYAYQVKTNDDIEKFQPYTIQLEKLKDFSER
jgi:hypothetical protein